MHKDVEEIRHFYCQKILPLVYDDSLSYYETLCKFRAKLDEVIKALNDISVDILADAYAYTDKKIAEQQSTMDTLVAELRALVAETKEELEDIIDDATIEFDSKINELGRQYRDFTNSVNANIILINRKIDEVNQHIDSSIIGVNARTDLAIAQNNEYIFDIIQNNLPTELKVTNMFTGARVSIQEMFNYLGSLHIDDGLTYTDMVSRDKTYNQLVSLNITYTDLILHGNTIYV